MIYNLVFFLCDIIRTMKKFFQHVFICIVLLLFLVGTFVFLYGKSAFQQTIQTLENTFQKVQSSISSTQEPVSLDVQKYPYYQMLSDNEKVVYAEMVNAIESMQTTFQPSVFITQENIQNIFEAVLYEQPQLFWVDHTYTFTYLDTGEIVDITVQFNETSTYIDEAKAAFDAQVKSIVQNASMYSTTLDKERYVHDALRDLVTYNVNASVNQSAYSALVNHETVCAGYAKAFQVIMQALDIPCYYVTGTSEGEDHAWDIVYIDGVYRNVDVTWDDTSYDPYQFFNFVDSSTHQRSEKATLLPVCQ